MAVAESGAEPGRPRFDVVLRGYQRQQVDDYVAGLLRSLGQVRAELAVARRSAAPAAAPESGRENRLRSPAGVPGSPGARAGAPAPVPWSVPDRAADPLPRQAPAAAVSAAPEVEPAAWADDQANPLPEVATAAGGQHRLLTGANPVVLERTVTLPPVDERAANAAEASPPGAPGVGGQPAPRPSPGPGGSPAARRGGPAADAVASTVRVPVVAPGPVGPRPAAPGPARLRPTPRPRTEGRSSVGGPEGPAEPQRAADGPPVHSGRNGATGSDRG